jgi:hypothetical protein
MSRATVVVLAAYLLVAPGTLTAQTKSHGHVSVGAGATDLSAGLDWIVKDGPVGIAAEVGVGWAFLAALNASYHFTGRQPSKHDVFATAGYARMGSSEFSSNGLTIGGGTVYWPAARVGLRFDAFKFLPVSTNHNIPAEERSPTRYWGVRAGVAFRFG